MQFEAAVSMIKKSCGILETRVGVVLFDVGCGRHESIAECYFARVDIPPAQVLRKFKQRGGGNMNVTCQQGIRM